MDEQRIYWKVRLIMTTQEKHNQLRSKAILDGFSASSRLSAEATTQEIQHYLERCYGNSPYLVLAIMAARRLERNIASTT